MTLLPEVISTEALDIKTRLITINKTHSDLIFENGLLLRNIFVNAIYREWGYDSFDQAIDTMQDQGLLTYGHRNARNFIAIIDMFEVLHLDGSMKELGVTKLREIASLKEADDQLEVLDHAAEMSVPEVVAEVKAIKDRRAGRDSDPFKPRMLKFSETQSKAFDEILAATRTVHGINDNVPAEAILIDVIMADWYSGLPVLSDGTVVMEAAAAA